MNDDSLHDALWERIHDRLDRRADPLDDPLVREALEADPTRLEEFASLVEAMRVVESQLPAPAALAPATSGFGRAVGFGSIAAAAVFAIVMAWPSRPSLDRVPPRETEIAATRDASVTRYRVSVATTVAGRSHRTTFDSASGRTSVQVAESSMNPPRPRDRIGPTRILVRQQENPR